MVESGRHRRTTLADLRARGVVYEADGAVWLRSTDYGDDKDRVLVKSDGEFTYLLPDIAYHRDKFARGFDLLIDVWGADHHGYVPRMKAAMQALGPRPRRAGVRHHPARQPAPGRGAGALLEARRRHRRAGRRARRGRARRGAPHLPAPVDRLAPDVRLRRGHAARPWTTPSTTCRWPTPGSAPSSGWPSEREVDAGAAGRGRPRAAHPPAGARRAARRSPSCPTPCVVAATDRAPHRITTWVRELAGAVHGFYHDCYVLGDGVAPSSPRPGSGSSRPPRSAWPSGSTCSASPRPSSCEAPVSALPLALLPDTAEVGDRGPAARSAGATPSSSPPSSAPRCSSTTRRTCGPAAARPSPPSGPGVNYATKAFLCTAMARLAAEEGCNLDVSTGGEYHVARAAGRGRRAARAARQQQERRRAAPGARRGHRPGGRRLLRRARPPRGPRRRGPARAAGPAADHPRRRGPHPRVRAHRPGRLQVRVRPGQRARPTRPCAGPSARRAVELVGLHAHIGSQVFEARFFEMAVEVLAPFVDRHGLPELSVGGGLGVAYVAGEDAPTITEWGRGGARRVRGRRASPPRSPPSPGRALVAQAAVTLYTVGTVKDLPGHPHLRGRRRGHERQPPAGALRQRLRGLPAPGGRRRATPRRHRRRQALRVRRRAGPRRPGARPTSSSATCWPRRSPVPTATRWAPTTTRSSGRRWCSSADGRARLVVRRETPDDLLALDVG